MTTEMENNTQHLPHGMDFGKLVGRAFGRFGRRKNRGESDTDGNRQHRGFWMVGRGRERNRGEQQKGRGRTPDAGNTGLKPLVIRNTPVGQWLRAFAPDVLRAFADLVPAGFLLDSIAQLIETRSFKKTNEPRSIVH